MARKVPRVQIFWPKFEKDQNGKDLPARYRGRTQQQFRDECDINKMMARYKQAGSLPARGAQDARFLDVSDVPSYQESLDRVLFAQAQFAALPASLRRVCENDPAVFLRNMQDPVWMKANARALVAVGLATERVASPPSPAAPAPGQGAQRAANKVRKKQSADADVDGEDA